MNEVNYNFKTLLNPAKQEPLRGYLTGCKNSKARGLAKNI